MHKWLQNIIGANPKLKYTLINQWRVELVSEKDHGLIFDILSTYFCFLLQILPRIIALTKLN